MFSAWDFNAWLVSVAVVLCILSFLTGFGMLVSALMSWIWEEKREVAEAPRMSRAANEPPIRKAA